MKRTPIKMRHGKTRRVQRGGAPYVVDGVIIGDYVGAIINGMPNGKGEMTYAEDDCEGNTLVHYKGTFINGAPSGRGIVKFKNGEVYKGELNEGFMDGDGIMTYPNGNEYDGEWHDDKKYGKGVLTYPDGSGYDGEWIQDKMHGQGIQTYSNGNSYEGEWADNAKNGQGTMRYADGSIMYDGMWEADYAHGYGKANYETGDVYQGLWNQGNKHGSIADAADNFVGKMTYADGTVYEGDWWYDTRHGEGTMTSADGKIMYKGLWRHDQQIQLFDPATGELADNTEYNATLETRRLNNFNNFPISDNMLYQSDTYEYYDLGEMEIRNVLEALAQNPDAIALQVNRTYNVLSIHDIVGVANNKNFIQYECPVIDRVHDVIVTEPYLSINGICGSQGVVPLFDIWRAIQSGRRAFELVATSRILLSIASHHIRFNYGSAVASNHCEIGKSATVYELKWLRIVDAPPNSTRKRKQFRIKKKGTKKLNRIINYMRGVRKQSRAQTQSRGR